MPVWGGAATSLELSLHFLFALAMKDFRSQLSAEYRWAISVNILWTLSLSRPGLSLFFYANNSDLLSSSFVNKMSSKLRPNEYASRAGKRMTFTPFILMPDASSFTAAIDSVPCIRPTRSSFKSCIIKSCFFSISSTLIVRLMRRS